MDSINFNSSLIKDLRAIRFVRKLLASHQIDADQFRNMLIHIIDGDACLLPLSASSKFNTDRAFIQFLFDSGREVAAAWYRQNRRYLGKESSFDLDQLLGPDS